MLNVFLSEFATGENAARFLRRWLSRNSRFLGYLERSLLMPDPGILQAIIQAVIDLLNSL